MEIVETHRETLNKASLLVYMSRWCSDCRAVMEFLTKFAIQFDQVDISEDEQAAQRLFAGIGKHATPYLEIDQSIFVRGYHKEEPGMFSAELLINELVSAIKTG